MRLFLRDLENMRQNKHRIFMFVISYGSLYLQKGWSFKLLETCKLEAASYPRRYATKELKGSKASTQLTPPDMERNKVSMLS